MFSTMPNSFDIHNLQAEWRCVLPSCPGVFHYYADNYNFNPSIKFISWCKFGQAQRWDRLDFPDFCLVFFPVNLINVIFSKIAQYPLQPAFVKNQPQQIAQPKFLQELTLSVV